MLKCRLRPGALRTGGACRTVGSVWPLRASEVELGIPVRGVDAIHPELLMRGLVLQGKLGSGREDGDVAVVCMEQLEWLREA